MTDMKKPLMGMSLYELKEVAKSLGMPAFTGGQMAKWLYTQHVKSIDEMTNISKTNRERLAEEYTIGCMEPIDCQVSKDGTIKYLFPTATGKHVETVYIPDHDRATLCVSSQVGCKMNCKFCMTGKQGFSANLTAGDILNQIHSLPEKEELTNIVFMGMGEPLDNIDEVIRIIRGSRNVQIAKQELIDRFELTDVQAQAIVDMRLRALTGLEREKLEAEYAELMEKIRKFQAILADRKLLLRVIREEILAVAEKYGDDRKTSIGYDVYDISTEDLIPRENTVIAMTKLGYIKRMTVDNFRSQNRGGRGIKGMQTIEDDYIEELLMTTTHHYLMFFTNTGRVYRLKAYEIPEAGRTARGTAIINLLQLAPGEKITAVIPLRKYEEGHYLMMATKKGLVKKTPIKDYENVRKTGLTAIVLRDDDELIEVKATDNNKDIILVTRDGQCIRFKETDVRSTGRASMGVRGMNLTDGDEVVAMQLNTQGDYLLVVSENGMGKRTAMSEFVVQNRGGKGVKCYKITEKTGNVVGAKAVNEENEIMMITTEGIIIRLQCADISVLGRITSGVKMINLTEGVTVASIAKVRDKDPEADTTTEKADGETGDNEEGSAEEAVTGSEEE